MDVYPPPASSLREMERTEPRALMWETRDLWDRAVIIDAFQVDQVWESRFIGFIEDEGDVGDHDLAKADHDDFSALLGS